MKRIFTETPLDEHTTRLRVRIEGDPCEAGTLLYRQMQSMLIQNLGNNPDLLLCGDMPFQTFRMYHDESKWVIELEARKQHGQDTNRPSSTREGRG